MFKTITAALALSLASAAAQAAPTPAELFALDTVAPISIDTAAEGASFETAYYCEWVTLYDYWGNWVTVYECY